MKEYILFEDHLAEQLKNEKFRKLYEKEGEILRKEIEEEKKKQINEKKEIAKLSLKIKKTIDKYNTLNGAKQEYQNLKKLYELESEMLNELQSYKRFNPKKNKKSSNNIIVEFMKLCNDLNLEVNLKIKNSK